MKKPHGWLAALSQRLRRRPPPQIPADLWRRTLARSPLFDFLNAAGQQRLKTLSEAFLAEKEFSAAQGLRLHDALLTAIAAQACLPILELGLSAYRGFVGVIVYPDAFLIPRTEMDAVGVLHEYAEGVSGEAWQGGPVILSWQDAQLGDYDDNVVIHEFAHQLDMLNGEADGIPALHSGLSFQEWQTTLHHAYDDFCDRLETGAPLPLDEYAGEDPSEFFAVASEAFFTAPRRLQTAYPDFYQLLSRYYRQNPAARFCVAEDDNAHDRNFQKDRESSKYNCSHNNSSARSP